MILHAYKMVRHFFEALRRFLLLCLGEESWYELLSSLHRRSRLFERACS